jgi:hypothetical protein
MRASFKQIPIAYNSVIKEPLPTVIMWEKFVVKGLSLVFTSEPNIGNHKLKNGDDTDDDDPLD